MTPSISTSLLMVVTLVPLATMPQSDIAETFPGSSTFRRDKRQGPGINIADFLLDFLEKLPQDAATLITHPQSETLTLIEKKRLVRGASELLRRLRVVSYTSTWDEVVEGSQQQSHLYLLLLPPNILPAFLSSLPVSSFSLSTIWLVEDQEKLLSTSNIYFPIDSQVYSFSTNLDRIEMDEVYQLHLFERRKDLRGHVFRGQTVNEPPYVVVDMDALEQGRITQIGGIIGDIWHGVIERSLNFSTTLIPSTDRQWGSLGSDGKWTGIIGALVEDRADLGVASFYVTPSRSKVVEFSPGITEGISRFFVKFPGQEVNWFTFLQPFAPTLWLVLLLCLASVAGLLTITYLYGQEIFIQPNSFIPQNSLLVIWGSWMAQGSWIDPKSIPSRIIFLVSFIFGVTIYTAYSAKLISFLSVAKVSLPFTSLEEMLEDGQYSVGLVKGTADYSLFMTAPPGTVRHSLVQKQIKSGDLVDSIEQMKESGQLSRILRRWLPDGKVDCSGGGQFQSMGLENMVSAFALIAAAAIVALIILLWELVKGLRKPRLVDKDKAKDHYQASPSRPFARDTTPIPSGRISGWGSVVDPLSRVQSNADLGPPSTSRRATPFPSD